MKKILSFALFMGSVLGLSAQGNQCPGCVINMSCTGTEPTLCPAALPNGMQGQYYDQDLTFFLPQQFTDAGSGTTVTMQQIVVTGISGMPSGLFWTTSSPNNTFVVTSDPNSQRGCAKVCGTPAIPGTFNATVSVLATVNTIIGVQTVNQSFILPLTIDPAAGGNPYFSFNPSSGCGTASVTYQALLNLGSPQVTQWEWDFGNGNTATGQNPPVQNYNAPGEYYPSLSTNVYNHVFNSLSATITGGWWCGDIEELNCGNGNADLKFDLNHGGTVYSSSTINNTLTPSWNNLGVALSSLTIGIQFTEIDNGPPFGSPNDNGGNFAFQVPGPGTYNFSTTAITSGGGGVSGSFTILLSLFDSYVISDTVNVYDLPPITTIASSSGSMVMCANRPITLSVYPGYSYEWFTNDTTLLTGVTDHFYAVPDPGFYPYTATYKVKISDPATGCAITTSNVSVTVLEDIPSLFGNVGAIYNNGQLSTAYSGFPSYQWMLNGTPLVPSGQTQNYIPTVNGNYSLIITNDAGCSDTSNVIQVFNVGFEDFADMNSFVSVYPNPSDGNFTLSLQHVISAMVTFSVLDLSGKTVFEEKYAVNEGSLTQSLSLNHLSSGIYTIQVQAGQESVRKKLVINK